MSHVFAFSITLGDGNGEDSGRDSWHKWLDSIDELTEDAVVQAVSDSIREQFAAARKQAGRLKGIDKKIGRKP